VTIGDFALSPTEAAACGAHDSNFNAFDGNCVMAARRSAALQCGRTEPWGPRLAHFAFGLVATGVARSREPRMVQPKWPPKEKRWGPRGPQRLLTHQLASTYRAGDRTRTGDVQLGKLSETNGVVASAANSGLRTPCSVQFPPGNWRLWCLVGPQWPPVSDGDARAISFGDEGLIFGFSGSRTTSWRSA